MSDTIGNLLAVLNWYKHTYEHPIRGLFCGLIAEIEFVESFLKELVNCTIADGCALLGSRIMQSIRESIPQLVGERFWEHEVCKFTSDVREIVELSKQKMREAFDILSGHAGHHVSAEAVRRLTGNALESLKDFPTVEGLNFPGEEQMETVKEKLRFLRNFLDFCLKRCPWKSKEFTEFLLDVASSALHFSYVWWSNELLETWAGTDIEVSVPDLLQKMKLHNELQVHMYVEILISAKQSGANYVVRDQIVSFANFVLKRSSVSKIHQNININDRLVFLIKVLLHTPSKFTRYWNSITTDIRIVLLEAASLDYSINTNEMTEEMLRNMNLKFCRLQEKMNFMKAEVVLTQLEDKLMVPLMDKIPVLHDDLKFFKELFYDPPEIEEDGTKFWTHAKILAEEATSFIYSIGNGITTEEMAIKMSLAVSVLQEKTKLIKAEVILNKMKNHDEDLRVPRKDQIEVLQEGLRFLRKFFMDHPDIEGNTEEREMFWTAYRAVSNELSSLVNSFTNESMISELDPLLVKLLRKISFIKAQVFLSQLRNCESRFVMDNPKEDKECVKLIQEQSEAVINEAAFFVCSLYEKVMNLEMDEEMTWLVRKLLEKIEVVKTKIGKIYLQPLKPLKLNVPKTDGLGFVNLLVENLRLLLKCKIYTIASVKPQIKMILEVMEFLKSFLNHIAKQRTEFDELQDLWKRIIDAAYQVEYAIDSSLVSGKVLYCVLCFADVLEVIKAIKEEVKEIYDKNCYAIGAQRMVKDAKRAPVPASTPVMDEVFVGIEDEARKIRDRLVGGMEQLDIVPIVGMAGLGKTTLAKKIYNDASVAYHFHVRAWCCISQVYEIRVLLLGILSAVIELTDEINKMSDEDIAEKLYKCLKGKRYFIVVDDLWNAEAWKDLRLSFPDDENGSRILITSRLLEVVRQTKPNCQPHSARLLSDDECWELLRSKIFRKEDCPKYLVEVGRQIARNCKGLPLAVVVISGLLLKMEKDIDLWKSVAESSTSHIIRDPQKKCMHMLELSYTHLPDNLKSCFLYLGAFPEDKEIPVRKLQWLWAAEGLSVKTDAKSSDEEAEDCLLDLIDRSLVFVTKRRSNGGVKSCHMHDLLRDFCLEKAKEENFLQRIDEYGKFFELSPTDLDCVVHKPIIYEQRRICIYSSYFLHSGRKPHGPQVRSLLFFPSGDKNPRIECDVPIICENFELLRVLDLESINMGDSFPTGIELLVLLRYLSVRGNITSIPPSIGNLWNLETLLVKGLRGEIMLPDAFWIMRSLRHVHINNRAGFGLLENEPDNSFPLENLVTFSSPALGRNNAEIILRRLPKLRKFRCICVDSGAYFRTLELLNRLESLKIFYHGRISHQRIFNFPKNIKKLTLSKFRFHWDEISTIGRLPNLEVLKLLFKAFEGPRWDMGEGEFLKLKFLKFDGLDIMQWNASEDPFPRLQRLVLHKCKKLEEIPSSFGNLPTLQAIEVQWCRTSVVASVMQIQKDQEDTGNSDLRVLVYPSQLVHG